MEQPLFENKDYEAICMALGDLAIHWALLEAQLEVCVNLTFNDHDGRTLAESNQIPRELKRKLRFLRLCFSRLPGLSAHSLEAKKLFDEIGNCSDDRHFVLHGALSSYDKDAMTVTFHRLDSERDDHVLKTRTYSASKLLSIGAQAQALFTTLHNLNLSLWK